MRFGITLFSLVGFYAGLLSAQFGCVVDSYSEALRSVKRFKAAYGNGVSTLVIIKNDLPLDLVYKDKKSCEGTFSILERWNIRCGTGLELNGRSMIPPGKYGVFLHVMQHPYATGSAGAIRFHYTDREVVEFAWSTPWWGTNKVGAKVDYYNNIYISHFMDCYGWDWKLRSNSYSNLGWYFATAQIKRDTYMSSPIVYFKAYKE